MQYAVAYNESVTNLVLADFTLARNGATGTIGSLSGSGSAYIVTVNNVSGDGRLGLNLVDNTPIVDQTMTHWSAISRASPSRSTRSLRRFR